MKVKVVLAALVALLVLAGSAEAFVYHMGYGQAKRETLAYEKEVCAKERGCTGFGVGFPCLRASESRFDCIMALFFEGTRPGEEIECNSVLHWGVNRSGFVALKSEGRPKCFAV
jgi:hypothetical protein